MAENTEPEYKLMKIIGMSAPTDEDIARSRAAKQWLADKESREATVTEPVCICWVTDESTWTRYGSAVEPGSQMEPNPDCPEHFPNHS